MSRKPLVPQAEGELAKLKMEVANEMGLDTDIDAADVYMGNAKSREAGLMSGFQNVGNAGGEMVRRMIAQAEQRLADEQNNWRI